MKMTTALGAALALTVSLAAPTTAAQRPTPTTDHPLTLVSGDRVRMTPDGSTLVDPGPGRERISFSVIKAGEHQYVLPSDAQPALRSGRLDRRLFDLTELRRAARPDGRVPLLVSPDNALAGAATATAGGLHATAAVPGAAWQAITSGGGRVWLDAVRTALLDRSTKQIGAPVAWQAGLSGKGVKVAVLDTGVDPHHPDLRSHTIVREDFSGSGSPDDGAGHGTHVASIIASTDSTYRGVAPEVTLLAGKVLSDNGSGSESAILAGMHWAVEQGADVVNLSLGATDMPGVDPLEEAVNTLSELHDVLFVAAAGNSPFRPGLLSSPATADAALAVGGVDRNDRLYDMSSFGPRAGDSGVKPDLTAPATDIVAAKAGGSEHVAMSGTSMATPHVSGAAALLRQLHPDWPARRIKATLTASARPSTGIRTFEQGTGRLDLAAAIKQTVTAQPVSLAFGVQAWPHDDDTVSVKDVTYHNAGDTDRTVDLSLETTGPDGGSNPFTVAPSRLTIPAGGTATARVTADTKRPNADGAYDGVLVARGDGVSVRTALSVDRESESYTTTVRVIGPDGAPTPEYSIVAHDPNSGFVFPYDPSGQVSFRLHRGNYMIAIHVRGPDGTDYLMPYPNLNLDRDTTITADAREARPVRLAPEDPAAVLEQTGYAYVERPSGLAMMGFRVWNLHTKHLGPPLPADRFLSYVLSLWRNGSTTYALPAMTKGTLFTGFERRFGPRDLAEIRTSVGASAAGQRWERMTVMAVDEIAIGVSLPGRDEAPATTSLRVGAGGDRWRQRMDLYESDDVEQSEVSLTSPDLTVTPGRTYEQTFNRPVFGPVGDAERSRNIIYVDVGAITDGAGNTGRTTYTSAKTRLSRDGAQIGQTDGSYGAFPVPADPGVYTLDLTADSRFSVGSHVEATWTFESARDGRIPLAMLRPEPVLREDGTARKDAPLVIPVHLLGADGGRVTVTRLMADVSYDGGQKWIPAVRLGTRAIVVRHPAEAGSVSLKIRAEWAGGSTGLTVVDAYHTR